MISFKKKLLLTLLALFAAICLGAGLLFLPEKPSAATEISDAKYFEIDEDGVFNGLTDEAISKIGRTNFTITLPNTVTAIGDGNENTGTDPTPNLLFGNDQYNIAQYLTGVSFAAAENITKIGYRAFVGCTSLKDIDLSKMSALTTLEDGVFRGCSSLTTMTLPADITEVSDYLFRGCSNLTSVTFMGTVTSIGISSFSGCGKLSLTLPESLTEIGASAFNNCDSLQVVNIPDSVTDIGESVFASCVNLTEVNLPENITIIPAYLFQNCSKLKKVNADENKDFNIPADVETIDKYAFSNCIAIKEITIPSKVRNIGLYSFYGIVGLTKINYYAVNALVESGAFAMSNYNLSAGVEVYIGAPSVNAVKRLPQALFAGHKAIKKVLFRNVDLHNGAQDFGVNVFNGCTGLEEVHFDDACNITLINEGAFEGCTSLNTVTGIENILLTTIGKKAFYDCRALSTIVIGRQVNQINDDAFLGCERLIEVQDLTTGDNALNITAGQQNENGEVARYAKYVYGEGGQSRIFTNPSGYQFYSDTSKSEILLIGYIGDETALTLPSGFNSNTYDIYKSAFKGNTEITSINFFNIASTANAKIIGDSAFEGCTSLTTVDLPAKLEEVGVNLFQGCTSLEHVYFHSNNKLSTISDNMFRNCKSLETIEIPAGVSVINSFAFSGCEKLVSVTFGGNSVTSIKGHAFDGCSSIAAIRIPANVTTVEAGCFEGCTNLKFVYLPDNADYKTDVFNNCADELILISKNKTLYTADKDKINLKSFVDKEKLTYIVPLTLFYEDGCVDGEHKINKLYKMPGDFSQTGLIWSQSGRMPIQGGHDNTQLYTESVWFKEKTYITEVTVKDLEELLAEDGVESLELHARYYAHPKLTAPNDVAYEVGKEYTIKDILTDIFREDGIAITGTRADELMRVFSFGIASHTFVNGAPDLEWDVSTKTITDAGTYVLNITLLNDGSYGGWASSKTVEFTITAGEVDITDLLVWKGLAPDIEVDANGNLVTRTLYFYNGTQTPNLEELDGQTRVEKVYKSNAYTIYTGNKITVSLEWIDSLHNYGEISSYTGNEAIEAGTYEASAIIKPFNNYIFNFRTDTATLAKLSSLNISFDKAKDGSIIVTKTWYIAISDTNQLVSSGAAGGFYDIPAEWNYSDGNQIPSRPTLSKIPLQADEKIKFTLAFTDTENNTISLNDGKKTAITEYEKYFNSSMPAGTYTAKFFIDDGYDENGKLVTGDPEGKTFVFTVKELIVTRTYANQVKSMLESNPDVSYSNNTLQFNGTDAVALLNMVYSQANPHSNYIWSKYSSYYTPFEIRYRVVRVGEENADENYYTEAEYASGGLDMVKPQAIGSYNIYYIIDAPNYGGSIEGSYRRNITHTLRPVLPAFDYDGNNVINSVIRSLERQVGLEYFDIYTMLDYTKLSDDDSLKRETISAPESLRIENMAKWGKEDAYTEIGTHVVFLKIKESYSSYIKWGDTTNRGYLYLSVEILASANSLVINEWQVGRFNEALNVPEMKVSYGAGTQYVFKLLVDGKDEYLYYTDNNINKYVPEGHRLADAPVGNYKLVAIARYNDTTMLEIETEITVHKVNIDFAKTPYLSGWSYRQIASDTDIAGQIKNKLTLGAGIDKGVLDEIVFKYAKADNYEAGRPPVASISALAENGYVPCGDYYVILTRKADGKYEEMNYAIKFSVLKAPNYWINAPEDTVVAQGSTGASLSSLFKTQFGTENDVRIELKKEGEDWKVFERSHVLNDEGTYEMRITVGSNDLADLQETVKLEVRKGYVAPVTGTNDGTSGADGVSDGAVVAAVVVFAILAVAVIAAGVVLIVLKNKKANAEYIKTVKSEMKRR